MQAAKRHKTIILWAARPVCVQKATCKSGLIKKPDERNKMTEVLLR